MKIGSNIKKYRNSAKLTQDELAKMVGISKNGLWNYENDKREVSINLLNKIAEVLEVSVNDLIGLAPSRMTTYINENDDITQVLPSNNGMINEDEAFLSLIKYINYIANNEEYIIGSGGEYEEIVNIVKEIIKGKILVFKQNRGKIINQSKSSNDKTIKFILDLIQIVEKEIESGKEPNENTIEILKPYYKYFPNEISESLKKYLDQ